MSGLDVEALLEATAQSSAKKTASTLKDESSRNDRTGRDRNGLDREGSRGRDDSRDRERDADHDRRRRDRRDLTPSRHRTAITIVGDAAVDDPARAHDPLAGAIAPEMTETVGTVESAQIAETKVVVLGTDPLVDDLVPHSLTKTSATVGRYSFNSLPLACEVTSSKNSSRRTLVLLTRLRL